MVQTVPSADYDKNWIYTRSYDEGGNRIKPVSCSGTTWYVYDATGNTLAIYTGVSGTMMAEVPVYGAERLGTYAVSGVTGWNNFDPRMYDSIP